MKRALVSLLCAAVLICGIAVVPVPSLGQARDSLIVAGYNGLTALFVRSAGLLNLKCDGTSMTCAWSGNTLTLSSGASSSDPCAATISSSTVTLFAGATSTAPCPIAIGSTSTRVTSPITITSPSATDTFYVAWLTGGTVAVGANSATVTCTSTGPTCSTSTGVTGFANLATANIPLYSFASVSTAWTVLSLTDSRPKMNYRALAQGTNVTITDNGTTATINATGGSSGTAPLTDFTDHASTSSVSSQGLGSGLTIASGAMNTTGRVTEIRGYYTTSGFGTHGSAYALKVGGVTVQVFNGLNITNLSSQNFYFDCELQTTGTNTVRSVCITFRGNNAAGPYQDVIDNTITTSGTLLVQFVTTTDGTVATITQNALEVIARNY